MWNNNCRALSHLRCHGNAAEEEDAADWQRRQEADTLAESKYRKLINEPSNNGLYQHHLRTTHKHTHTYIYWTVKQVRIYTVFQKKRSP